MSMDARGYYAVLGVSPFASIGVIKAAYRVLAKECHPDSGGVTDGGARFRFLTEAYDVLSDPARRAEYDNYEDEPPAKERDEQVTINPIQCDHCGKVTAQPRRLAFWRVTSFVLATQRSPVQKIYCAKCAASEELKSTIWTSLLGWWGIPWGPVWTISCGVKNALGGEHEHQIDEALLWQNAVAFATHGQGELAVGLANTVRKSGDAELAQRAADLIRFCGERGVDPTTSLKDVWQRSAVRSFLLLAILFALPAAAVTAYWISATSTAANEITANSQPSSADAPIAPSSSGESPMATQPTETAEPPVALCETLPANGAILTDDRPSSKEGHVLTIENGTEGDAIVKVRDATSDKTLASFFIRQGRSANLESIPDGTYRFQYAFGELGEDCTTFAKLDSAGEFPEAKTYVTEYEGGYIVRGHQTFTLYATPGGNVRPNAISADEFNK